MLPELSAEELTRYEWQSWTPGFETAGQLRLKASSILISRIGGVGGTAALELAAAGVGKLILAHGGELRLNDLNRQLLMSTDHVGESRLPQAVAKLRDLNPHVELLPFHSNVTEQNASELVGHADLVISAAPLFEERLLMNREAVRQKKAIIQCSMHDLEASVMVTIPGKTACLACVTPSPPSWWRREFPVFGAVAGTAGCIAAMEAIKLITGLGTSLAGGLISIDFRDLRVRKVSVARDPDCPVCSANAKP